MIKDFSKLKFDIIIEAGQSNAEGCGFGKIDNHFKPNPRVWYMNKDFTISAASEHINFRRNIVCASLDLSFCDEYIASSLLEEDRNLIVIRSAVGGTGFHNDDLWGLQGNLFHAMMDMTDSILALNPENRVKALLWHQGERETRFNISFEEHYQNMSRLITKVRAKYGPKLPFIAADFVPIWKASMEPSSGIIASANKKVCEDAGFSSFVETDGLLSNREENGPEWETIHFGISSQYELGRRYFKAYTSILGLK